jgi:hypothetical protein
MVRSSRLAHDGSTWLSWLADPGSSRAPCAHRWCSPVGPDPAVPVPRGAERPRSAGMSAGAQDRTCDRTRPTSSGPGTRSARGNAERRSARVRHSGTGCSHAPRPGSRRRGSGMSTPSTATTRNRSSAGARVRQPTQVRTGPSRGSTFGLARFRPGRRTGSECSAGAIDAPPPPLSRPAPCRPTRDRPAAERPRRRPAARP